MPRTTAARVQGVLQRDYDFLRNPSLEEPIAAAASLVDAVQNLAANQLCVPTALRTPSATLLATLETWLAAHFYQQNDPGYQSRSTAGASGSFTGQTTQGLKNTRYGQQAILLDTTRVLAALDTGKFASAAWLGKTTDERTDWDQRNGPGGE